MPTVEYRVIVYFFIYKTNDGFHTKNTIKFQNLRLAHFSHQLSDPLQNVSLHNQVFVVSFYFHPKNQQ
jgi:hypothetical protein